MNRQRQYRPQRSPTKQSAEIEEQYYRAKEIMRSDLSMLEQENAILKLKCKKVSELEDKVEMVLKQNAQLLSENQKLSRFLHQQKSENQIARNKWETAANQKASLMGEFELERKRLLRELQILGDKFSEEEALKNEEISEIRKSYQTQLQNIKRQMQNSQNSYEIQIKKLRQYLDKSNHETSEYANRLKRLNSETEYQIVKLKEEKEKYKAQLTYMEADHVKELEALKNKFETNYHEDLEALKRVHLNNLEQAQLENARLKEALEDRNRQIDGLVNKFNKQRTYYQDTINYLKRDCEGYRAKIVQTEQLGSLQLGELREKLQVYHEAQIEQFREKQMFQLKAFEDEIARLENINHGKNIEIEQLIKDKVTTRGMFDSELLRVKDDYSALQQKHKDLELKYLDMNTQGNNRLNDREKHIQYLEDVIKTQKSNHQSENIGLQRIIESIKQQLTNQKLIFRENEQSYKEQIAKMNHELNETKIKAELEKADYQRQVSDLQSDLNGTSHNLTTRADALNSKNRMIQKQNQGLKSNIIMKEKQIKNLVQRLKASSERQSKLEAEIDELRSKMIKREQRSNEAIGQQKSRLQASFNYTLENLKADHETALRLEANRYRDLQQKLKRKEGQLQQLLRMYKKMTDEIQVLTEQQANKKDITLKFPGATADLIATKNLFDVYLKTKVLDVCGDALKENRS